MHAENPTAAILAEHATPTSELLLRATRNLERSREAIDEVFALLGR